MLCKQCRQGLDQTERTPAVAASTERPVRRRWPWSRGRRNIDNLKPRDNLSKVLNLEWTHHSPANGLTSATTRRCLVCSSLFQYLETNGHSSFLDLEASSLKCRILKNEALSIDNEVLIAAPEFDLLIPGSMAPRPDDLGPGLGLGLPPTINLSARGPFYCEPLPTGDLPAYSGSLEVVELSRRWLKQCMQSHHCAKPQVSAWYPDRLLDLTSHHPKLVITKDRRPLYRDYATLSHCWGPDPSFYTLTQSNLAEACSGVHIDQLPTTFRHAIEICRRLEIYYLWIDSVCILQSGLGSVEDWQHQSAAMGKIYANCALNISADRAAGPSEGFFTTREVSPTLTGCKKSEIAIVDCRMWEQLFTSPLSTRGWVMQERLMSPRVLHFGSKQVFWECNELPLCCESFPSGFPKTLLPKMNISPFNLATCDGVPFWRQIVQAYSRTSLIYPENDKFVAISAVADYLATFLHEEYCAGFFYSDLPRALLWEIDRGDANPRPSSGPYRAPTWSWAIIDGPIKWKPKQSIYTETIAKFLKLEAWPVQGQRLSGQLNAAWLVLQAHLIESSYRSTESTPSIFVINGHVPCDTSISFDNPDLETDNDRCNQLLESCLYLPIVCGYRDNLTYFLAIILRTAPSRKSGDDVYVRCGYIESRFPIELRWNRDLLLPPQRRVTLV